MKQLHWTLLLLSLLLLDLPGSSGEEKAEEVIGALGDSVTFQLKVSEPFTRITWLKVQRNGVPRAVAVLKPQENCATYIFLPDLEGRLNVSRDCKGLLVKNLNQDDSRTYQAQIKLDGQKEPLKLFFDLHVYKRLSDADLSIQCKETGNGTWWLNCSAEPWEDGVSFAMALGNQREDPGRNFYLGNNLEESSLSITCVAKSPVSTAFRTESVKDICKMPNSITEYHGPWARIGTTTALALIIAKVFISGCVFARWPCCSLGREGYRKGTRPHHST